MKTKSSSSPKLHKNLVDAVIDALESIFDKGIYADRAIERLLKSNRKWGSKDRGFIAESTYEMVRWWRFLWEVYGKPPSLKRAELYHLFGIYWLSKGYGLPETWRSFESIWDFNFKQAKSHLPNEVGSLQSFPIWMDDLLRNEFGTEWPKMAKALNQSAKLIARANTLKTNRSELIAKFAEENIEVLALEKNETGIVFKQKQNFFNHPLFKKGFFEIQDGGSQMIAEFLNPKPGMKVIDACAGAGGKTLQMAAMMENKGSIIAMDVEAWKLKEFQKRAKRNSVHNVEIKAIESNKTIKRLHNRADRLLLDVPCSGTGVIKRNPDTKWKLQPQAIEKVRALQMDIVNNYSKMLKVGGEMVYATCSLLTSENEDQVRNFLDQNQNFEFLAEQRIHPSETSDGFYMARLKRLS